MTLKNNIVVRLIKGFYNFILRIFRKEEKKVYKSRNNIDKWSEFEKELCTLINEYKTQNNIRTLEPDELIYLHSELRAIHYKQLNQLDDHIGLQQTREILHAFGLKSIGENLGVFPEEVTAKQVLHAWVHSPGHKAILDNRNSKFIGVGEATRGRKKFVCLLVAY